MLLCLMNNTQPTKLKRLIAKHDKRVEKFQTEEAALFHLYAVELCKKIKKGIPKFEGCHIGNGYLFLEPMDLPIPYVHDGDCEKERLSNVLGYYYGGKWTDGWNFCLSARTLQALADLYELDLFIDDRDSNVNDLHVDKEELE